MNIVPLLTFYVLSSKTQFYKNHDVNEIASSLLYVIEKFFTPRSSSFVFIVSCQRPHTMNFYKDLMEILFDYWGDIKTQIVINHDLGGPATPGEGIYNLLLVDSSESFLKLDLASKVRNYDTNEFYHIFLQNRDRFLTDDIQRILDYCWRHYIINVNIQVQRRSGEIVVYSYFPFTASHCGRVIPVEVNRFHNGTMKNVDLFPAKVSNMHQCPVRVATWDFPPYMWVNTPQEGPIQIIGFEGKILLQLSSLMNFSLEIVVPPNNEKRGIVTHNHSTGAIGMLQNRMADLSLAYFWYTKSRARLATPSHAYFQSINVAVIVSSNYELVHSNWLPFRPIALVVILSAFLVFLTLLFGLAKLQTVAVFFQDVRYRNIGLNHIGSTLGLSTLFKPTQNWARIFIMTWMVYSLIIRTNYGAVLFHIMRNNLFWKAPSTLQDVVRLNYTFTLKLAGYYALQQTSVFTETGLRHIIVPNNGDSLLFLEDNPKERLITISPLEVVVHYMIKNKKAGVFKVFKESLMIQNSCMYFSKHSFLVDRVNFLLQRISAVGLIEAWTRESFDISHLQPSKTPDQLTIGMGELSVVFGVCGAMLCCSFVVFCLEMLSVRVRILRSILSRI